MKITQIEALSERRLDRHATKSDPISLLLLATNGKNYGSRRL
jgi:hypothetical protein